MSKTQLSYSSAQLLLNCEQRYWHYKVNGTPTDEDYDDDKKAFNVGKTFHEVLELNNHTSKDLQKLLKEACKKYDTEDEKLLIYAMLLKYLDLHVASGLSAVHCELAINTDEVIGFIDVIMVDAHGFWYIVDLKTSASWRESTLSRLPMDYQLNLYAHFAEQMAPTLDLDPTRFAGCCYRVTTKSKAAQKASETDSAFVKRVYGSIKSLDIFVPRSALKTEVIWDRHMEAHTRATELKQGSVPLRNYSYCESYFSPCPYWKNCHGALNSKCNSKVIMNTAQSYKNFNEAIDSL